MKITQTITYAKLSARATTLLERCETLKTELHDTQGELDRVQTALHALEEADREFQDNE